MNIILIAIILYIVLILCKNYIFPLYSKRQEEKMKKKFFKENPHINPDEFSKKLEERKTQQPFSLGGKRKYKT